MSENHSHYNLEKQTAGIQKLAAEHKLNGPEFVGQGLCKSIGSDCYGFYITDIRHTRTGKPLVGISHAKTVMHGSWTEGTEDCSIDMATAKPTEWLTTYGKQRDGSPKWWYCDAFGDRKSPGGWNMGKADFGWNGAFAYRDPSF